MRSMEHEWGRLKSERQEFHSHFISRTFVRTAPHIPSERGKAERIRKFSMFLEFLRDRREARQRQSRVRHPLLQISACGFDRAAVGKVPEGIPQEIGKMSMHTIDFSFALETIRATKCPSDPSVPKRPRHDFLYIRVF